MIENKYLAGSSRIRRVGWVLVILGAVIAVPLWLLWLFPATHAWGFAMVAASSVIPFVWWPTALILLGLLLILRGWVWLIPGLLALAMLVYLRIPPFPSGPEDPPGGDLQFISVNAQYGRLDVDELLALVTDETDLIAVQENTPQFQEALLAAIGDELPHVVGTARTDAGGTAVYSREPVELVSSYDEVFTNLIVRTSPQAEREFTVAVVHAAPPQLGGAVWRDDARAIAQWLAPHVELGFMVVGDFNAIDQHLTMGFFREIGLHDPQTSWNARQSALEMWEPTWPVGHTVPPFARIDHVLIPNLTTYSPTRYVELAGTDHKAVIGGVFASR